MPRGREAGEGWAGTFELADANYPYREGINSKILLYSIRNHTHYPLKNHNGKLYIYIYITEALCCTAGIKTALLINYISINKINFLTNHSLTFKSKDCFIRIKHNEQLP